MKFLSCESLLTLELRRWTAGNVKPLLIGDPISALRVVSVSLQQEAIMGFGRGLFLWLLGVPIPIIILVALLWHH